MGCFWLYFSATAFAQAPASSLSSSQRTNPNFVLVPDRGNVSVLKLDDQLRVGKKYVGWVFTAERFRLHNLPDRPQ